ncbi:metallophosphoesterase [Methylophaga pinxianii]|uniref:metallophosphoesterase n=1 Tax=Methylophaga pinxianii TaxID=2881052 RepID=UPI001CF2A8AA|nr:metallophosphoesterase [Methylophaga pinxianii]MCB2426431.1 metallophosphoesterase [Methylophaga pinxianii]UPH45002.1 metallophosphoesterase [Methylophaga pinxianii]
MYDLIGDIHGYAQPLRKLLIKLGYTENGDDFSHPERKVIFLGDFIDRGPNQVEVCAIARTMIEHDHAYSIMGNHEFNAVAYATKDPSNNDTYLRPHNEKTYLQHKAFLDEVYEYSALHNELINWFKDIATLSRPILTFPPNLRP